MMTIKEKAVRFLTALTDVYRDEESRGLEAFSAVEFSDDVTEDFTSMLIALHYICESVAGYDGDLIDFTHMLNKLAVQYIMDGETEDNND